MKTRRLITSFYVEALLLVAVFVIVILVTTQVFGLGRQESFEAKLLTNAVCLAENAAEAVSAVGSEEELAALMDEDGNATLAAGAVLVRYAEDMTPDPDGSITVEITWDPQDDAKRLTDHRITVTHDGKEEPVYVLRTSVFSGEVSP